MNYNIIKLLEGNDFSQLQFILQELSPEVITELINALPKKYVKTVISLIERQKACEVYPLLKPKMQKILLSEFPLGYFNVPTEPKSYSQITLNPADYDNVSDYIVEIIELLNDRQFDTLKPLLNSLYPADIAELLVKLSFDDATIFFRFLNKKLSADTLLALPSETANRLFCTLNSLELKAILNCYEIEQVAELSQKLTKKNAKALYNTLSFDKKQKLNEHKNYVENCAGALMTTHYAYLKQDDTIKEAFDKIKTFARSFDDVYNCYVLNEDNSLLGVISVKDMLLADQNEYVATLMNRKVIKATTRTDDDQIAKLFIKYDLVSLPIVDERNIVLGVITAKDAVDIISKARLADIGNIGQVGDSETPYLQTSVWRIWLKRAPWLLLLMVSATFTGLIISKNEEILNLPQIGIILTACIPMLMDTGGNAGCQSSVTAIRSIALGELEFKDCFKAVWKETRVALLVSLTLSIVCFGKLMLVDKLYLNGTLGYIIAGVICLSMSFTIILAKTLGCFLSLLAKKCHVDPAVIVSPFLTTIVDAVSLLIYCAFSTWLLAPLVA